MYTSSHLDQCQVSSLVSIVARHLSPFKALSLESCDTRLIQQILQHKKAIIVIIKTETWFSSQSQVLLQYLSAVKRKQVLHLTLDMSRKLPHLHQASEVPPQHRSGWPHTKDLPDLLSATWQKNSQTVYRRAWLALMYPGPGKARGCYTSVTDWLIH